MIKNLLKNLFLISVLLHSTSAFAQLPQNTPSSDNSNSTPTNTNNDLKKNLGDTINNVSDAVNSLDKTSLLNNIQGGMANLLMGNKNISLMFDDKENDNIDRAIDSYKSNQSFSPDADTENPDENQKKEANASEDDVLLAKKEDDFNEKSYIYLASIMYSTAQDWVVWINDKKITTKTNDATKELYLKSVQKDQVSILWNVSPSKLKVLLGKKADTLKLTPNDNGQIEVKFDLRPNQTFVLGSNSVVEGRSIVNMLKKKEEEKKSKLDDLRKSLR